MTAERDDIRFDWARGARTGVPEAVFATGKSTAQLESILSDAAERQAVVLFTRMRTVAFDALRPDFRNVMDHDAISQTAIFGTPRARPDLQGQVAIVAAGSSDMPVALEARRSLIASGVSAPVYADVGVAGLWRLLDVADELRSFSVLIAVAGMEGALFSVLAGLVPGLVIAVPSSVGYGVSSNGEAALSSALATCAPGVVTVNVDNGFGAAAASLKIVLGRADGGQ